MDRIPAQTKLDEFAVWGVTGLTGSGGKHPAAEGA